MIIAVFSNWFVRLNVLSCEKRAWTADHCNQRRLCKFANISPQRSCAWANKGAWLQHAINILSQTGCFIEKVQMVRCSLRSEPTGEGILPSREMSTSFARTVISECWRFQRLLDRAALVGLRCISAVLCKSKAKTVYRRLWENVTPE